MYFQSAHELESWTERAEILKTTVFLASIYTSQYHSTCVYPGPGLYQIPHQ